MSLRFLLIERDEDFRITTEGLLQTLGHVCEPVSSVESAWEQLQRAAPDVVLVDLDMPEGREFVRDLRRVGPVAVVGMTTGRHEDAEDHDITLMKPFRLHDLVQAVSAAAVIRNRSAQRT